MNEKTAKSAEEIRKQSLASVAILVHGDVAHQLRGKLGSQWDSFEQKAFLATGEAAHPFLLKSRDPAKSLPEGVYTLRANIFTLSKYGDIECKVWPESFIFVRKLKDNEKALFSVSVEL